MMEQKLRAWWVPNPPRKAFEFPVKTIEEAKLVLRALADYDLYLGDDLVSVNAGGLSVLAEDGEWEEWDSEDGDIGDVMREE